MASIPSNYGTPLITHVYNKTLASGSTYTDPDNIIVFESVAASVCILNHDSEDVKVYINDCATGFTLDGMSTITFSGGDIHIWKLAFSNHLSGSTASYIEVIYSGII